MADKLSNILDQIVLPAELQKIGLLGSSCLVLRVSSAGSVKYIYLSIGMPKMFAFAPESPACPYPEATWMGPHLAAIKNNNITKISCVEGQNLINIYFGGDYILKISYVGANGNAVLVNNAGIVLVAWHKNRYNTAGQEYEVSSKMPTVALEHVAKNELVDFVLAEEFKRMREIAEKHLLSQKKKLEKRLKLIKTDIEEAKNSAEYLKWGELLKANYHLLARGMHSVKLVDYFSAEMTEFEIQLDQKKTPQENIKYYFNKSSKLQRSVAYAQDRLNMTNYDLDKINTLLSELDLASDISHFTKILPQAKKAIAKKTKIKVQPRFKTFTSGDGLQIMVGGNAKDNDYLTIKVANGNDMWLHTRNRPGCHVIIRATKKPAPMNSILEAARLCAHFSKIKDGELVDITYLQKKHISKPKGAKAGSVLIAGGKTATVRYSLKEVKKWIASRAIENKDLNF